MICCDGCEEWFHGKCVGITMQQGKIMEKQGKEYVCEKCQGNVIIYEISFSKSTRNVYFKITMYTENQQFKV